MINEMCFHIQQTQTLCLSAGQVEYSEFIRAVFMKTAACCWKQGRWVLWDWTKSAKLWVVTPKELKDAQNLNKTEGNCRVGGNLSLQETPFIPHMVIWSIVNMKVLISAVLSWDTLI